MYVNGVKNYVYINGRLSFLQFLLQLLGIAQDTQATVNQTLEITNQTLQIVTNLNNTQGNTIYEQLPILKSADARTWTDVPATISTKVFVGSEVIEDAVCDVDVVAQSNGSVLLETNTTYDNSTKLYSFTWTPDTEGTYTAYWNCSGGATLNARQVFEAKWIDVGQGVFMQSVS
jgi:hypothetical protein